MTDMFKESGQITTPLYCHQCSKNFMAILDYDIDGQHVVECPHCGHEHCRRIEKGRITDDRWDARNGNRIDVEKRNVWKHDVLQAQTTTAAFFLREKWLQKYKR